jgi:hypothetical protein
MHARAAADVGGSGAYLEHRFWIQSRAVGGVDRGRVDCFAALRILSGDGLGAWRTHRALYGIFAAARVGVDAKFGARVHARTVRHLVFAGLPGKRYVRGSACGRRWNQARGRQGVLVHCVSGAAQHGQPGVFLHRQRRPRGACDVPDAYDATERNMVSPQGFGVGSNDDVLSLAKASVPARRRGGLALSTGKPAALR